MRPIFASLALIFGLSLAAEPARADAVVVAVDPQFAPVAQMLTRAFAEQSGIELQLSLLEGGRPAAEVDVLLGPDTALALHLAETGLALPETQVTYAMGAAGTPAAAEPRDAILMAGAAEKAAAREFMAFLMTPDAWDLIVTHGYGAY